MWPKKSITVVVAALAATTAFTATTAVAQPAADRSVAKASAPGVPAEGAAQAARAGARTDPSLQTLRQLGKRAHLKVGVAVGMEALDQDATYRHLVATQFS